MTGEFFRVRRVSEALEEFRPGRRTPVTSVPLEAAYARVLARDARASGPLPGFSRASVDGYAVRAADTFGSSDVQPAYLTVVGAVAMGRRSTVRVGQGHAVDIATGGALPAGADAVVMVEHTTMLGDGVLEVNRPVAPGDAVVRPDEDVAANGLLARAGCPLRAGQIGALAAAGLADVSVHARPRVGILSTGDELVPPETRHLETGQVRDAISPALVGLVGEAGGEGLRLGIVGDDRGVLRRALAAAVEDFDVVVVSAGSSVGQRDGTAEAVASLAPPGIWCHGLAVKPGKPTLLAECGGVPLIGLPGNPLSALVVFRLIGLPLIRRVGGWSSAPRRATTTSRLSRDVPSAPGRLDVVQVALRDGAAEPLFGKSALLSILSRSDGQILVPEDDSGLLAEQDVEVELYG